VPAPASDVVDGQTRRHDTEPAAIIPEVSIPDFVVKACPFSI
jgi:hypothetical protein